MKTRHILGTAAAAALVAAIAGQIGGWTAADEDGGDAAAQVAPRAAEPTAAPPPAASALSGSALEVPSVLITLVEEVWVPARESGVLATLAVRENDLVEEDQLLARIDDAEAQLDKRKAEIELQIARKTAGNNVKVRFARAAAEVARNEYDRSLDSRRRFGTSVTDSALERDRLQWERSVLDIEQSEHEFAVEGLTAQLKENELAMAVRGVERRQVLSPIAGVVVEINRRRGEWVQPGEQVFRVLRIDRLRAEGFLNADEVQGELAGRRAVLHVDLPGRPNEQFEGKVTFVSPEIDPVNKQIRFWAEIENRNRLLRPGLKASLVIDVPAATAAR
ncbi:MAG TPA: HlyD family efflux transporter periplasmic adaptor subunit [Planctomycetaceae bacterium]|nr:HlyD family efflux transporter periplasmic adaptor subunit [Planctomycetaceae bacterium]